MGKSKRKGKKAWRANISTSEIEDSFAKSTKDALSGGPLTDVPDDSLFFVDKSKDLSVKRKIEKNREKVLRCDSVLRKNPFVQAVPSSKTKNSKANNKKVPEPPKDTAARADSKDAPDSNSNMVDLWENQGESGDTIRKVSKPSVIPAVEVEPAGCSYNPSFEAHQDVLAQAVAQEMQKVYQNELGPKPVPLTVPDSGKVIDEEDMFFLEAGDGNDDDADVEELSDDGDDTTEKRPKKTKVVTRVELNRRARLKEQRRKEAEAKKKDELGKEIDSLPDIIQEIAKEDEEKQKRHIRKIVAKQERLKSCPPRLGKHKFEPAPVQVLLSEEITGSLRKLKACCTLVKDRFKSLEKRGLIEPTKSRRR